MQELDAIQAKAVEYACSVQYRMVTVSGEAGTGKTSIIKMIAQWCKDNHYSFVIAAPTGKAAKRISEATGFEAKTMHRLLEYTNPGEVDEETGEAAIASEPRRDRSNPLDEKFILVDEYAMVNVELHRNLIAALPQGACLRLFGDKSQLAPIEAHKLARHIWPFEDCLKLSTNAHKSVELVNVYRQGEGSGVLAAARQIKLGRMPARNTEFTLKITDRHVDELLKYITEKSEEGIDFSSMSNQIISPAARKSWLSSQRLNGTLQKMYINSTDFGIWLPRNKWDKTEAYVHVGDKIVFSKNMYDMRDYYDRYAQWIDNYKPEMSSYIPVPASKYALNGEVGKIISIDDYGGFEVDLGDRIVEVPHIFKDYWAARSMLFEYDPRKNVDLAYVLTTHKTQGSEYDNIVYLVDKGLYYLSNRRNFYTAVTRARKSAHIIADQKGLMNSLREQVNDR